MRGSRRGRSSLPIHVSSSRFFRSAIASPLPLFPGGVREHPPDGEDGLALRLRFQLALNVLDQLRAFLVDVVLGVEKLSPLGGTPLLQRLDEFQRLELLRENDGGLRSL